MNNYVTVTTVTVTDTSVTVTTFTVTTLTVTTFTDIQEPNTNGCLHHFCWGKKYATFKLFYFVM